MNNIEHLLIEIPLHFENQIYTDVFKDKNNKTLKETIETSKYRLMCYPYFRQVTLKITQPFDILAS